MRLMRSDLGRSFRKSGLLAWEGHNHLGVMLSGRLCQGGGSEMGRQARASGSKSSLEVPGRGDAGGREDLSHLCWGGMQGIGGAGWAEPALIWLNFFSVLSDAGCNSFQFCF